MSTESFIRLATVALIVLAAQAACTTTTDPDNGNGNGGGGTAPVASVTVSPASPTIQVGGSVQLMAQARDAQGNVLSGRSVAWSSDNTDVATVDDTGIVTGEAAGSTTITATVEGQTGNASINVTQVGTGAIGFVLVMDGFGLPIDLTAPPGDATRLFVVEKAGQVRIIENGQLLAAPFLDLSGQVSAGFEQGLLSMAFHPDYATNGFFYVNYTDLNDATQVVRYTVSSDPNVADASSALTILAVDQPDDEHNGGHLVFGPDGMLYVALGDGGTGADAANHGQNPGTLLGSLLRIDVDGANPYAIPADNPFVDDPTGADEVWAYGLRNPWRIAFDPVEDLIFIADVGQNSIEEVNAQPANAAPVNYGWRILEGSQCFSPPNCDPTGLGLTMPAVEYAHDESGFCSGSVTGGYAYRGGAMPSLRGHYFYADWCQQWIRSFRYVNGQVVDETEWLTGVGGVVSFGLDALGELYVLMDDGRVLRIVPA